MDRVCIIVHYGGKWESQPNGDVKYTGGSIKGFRIERDIGYNQLLELLNNKLQLNVESSAINLSARFVYVNSEASPIMRIENDDDVEFFVEYCAGNKEKFVPLIVTVAENIDKSNQRGSSHRKNVAWEIDKDVCQPVHKHIASLDQIEELVFFQNNNMSVEGVHWNYRSQL
jgi:hypothetical protein